ncbi:MAG: leucine-rich repeat domain-containing protein [Lachnospiraceae bacterium]|nr:leucine-rich repeat domain-containing protein [Candidatus Merdinaster equi]
MKNKRISKRIVTIFLCLLVALTAFFLPEFSMEVKAGMPVEIGGIRYEVEDSTLTAAVSGCTSVGAIDIPATITSGSKTYRVTEVQGYAFISKDSITAIHLPDSITSIGDKAFYNCGNLSHITIPQNVTSIGYEAFFLAGLNTIEFKGTTPPVGLDSTAPRLAAKIIVPIGCVDEYVRLGLLSGYVVEEATPELPPTPGNSLSINGCAHKLEWKTTREATVEIEGISSLICSKCGYVEMKRNIPSDTVAYNTFAKELEKQIKNAQLGDTLKLDLKAWHSVPQYLMERIISCGCDVELIYKYKGTNYDIIIRNGYGQNLDIPWYGPLLMNSLYGN